MFFDPTYILFVMLPALIISGLAQLYVRNQYGKWSQRANSRNLTGARTAQMIMQSYGLRTNLEVTPQTLGDHYDPTNQTVRLSPGVANQPSIASMAIAAHEYGHVQQYAEKSPLIGARSLILPVARYGDSFAFILMFLGLLINSFGLAFIGLIGFGFAALFTVLTLPVEFDASRRAMKMLDEMGVLSTREDRAGAQAVLRAAALTYVAAMVVAILNLAYYALLVFGMNRD